MNTSEWYGLYTGSWQGDIVPEAFSHPAKFNRALIRKIYAHLLENGYIKPCDTIADPFGGVALGALDAMMSGLNWQGCELEEKFVGLGRANIALWNERYGRHFPKWGTAVLHQGDSRQLASILQAADVVVSSPPYATDTVHDRNMIDLNKSEGSKAGRNSQANQMRGYGKTHGQLGSMPAGDYDAVVSSPPFSGDKNLMPINGQGVRADMVAQGKMPESQTQKSLGNLALLRADEQGLAAVVSSPPYGDAVSGQGEGPGARYDQIYHKGDNAYKNSSQAEYGRTDGNLGNMPMVDGVVGSPPFMYTHAGHNSGEYFRGIGGVGHDGANYSDESPREGTIGGDRTSKEAELERKKRAENIANLGNIVVTGNQGNLVNTDTFWIAARLIVEQCYNILKPGGVAAWVTGDFVRNKQRVFFGQQWLQLCESVGFVGVEWVRAWKVKPGAKQLAIDGNHRDHTTEQISFFRRLSNGKNPEAAVRNEDVIIMVKAENQ